MALPLNFPELSQWPPKLASTFSPLTKETPLKRYYEILRKYHRMCNCMYVCVCVYLPTHTYSEFCTPVSVNFPSNAGFILLKKNKQTNPFIIPVSQLRQLFQVLHMFHLTLFFKSFHPLHLTQTSLFKLTLSPFHLPYWTIPNTAS